MSDFATSGERHTPRRRNKDTNRAVELAASGSVEAAEEAAPDKPWMTPADDWVDEVKMIFNAMKSDVMAQFMTPVGWAQLYAKCSAWSREFDEKFLGISQDGDIKYGTAPIPAATLADIQRTLDSFGGSEKSRREMRILIDPTPSDNAAKTGGDAKMAAKSAIARPVRRQLGG